MQTYFLNIFSKTYSDEVADVSLIDNNIKNIVHILNCFFSIERIFKGIWSLNDKLSHGPEGIPSYFLKRCVTTINRPIHILLQQSKILFHIGGQVLLFSTFQKIGESSDNFPENTKTYFKLPRIIFQQFKHL